MKNLLYLSLLILLPSYFSFGQNIKKDKESVEAFFWGKDDFIDEPFVVPEKWKNESTPDFRFCPKMPQVISHSSDLGANNDALDNFCKNILLLEEKLGCCFMQLPPYFGMDRLPVLEHFFRRFPKEIRLAVELRHESIFSNKKNQKEEF